MNGAGGDATDRAHTAEADAPRPRAVDPALASGARAVYADLRYRDVFWAERPYEDLADRAALRALLPRGGGRLLDVGAGYGRLVDEYDDFREVILVDASAVHVAAARERFAGSDRVSVLEADATSIPLEDATVDVVVCVRLLHHFEDAAPVVREIGRVLRPGGALVLEVANKRNAKAIARWLMRRRRQSPFSPGPATYKPFHHDHAPADVERWLREAGLRSERRLAVSLFRWRPLTGRVPADALVRVERPLQRLLGPLAPGPSLFVRARRVEREV